MEMLFLSVTTMTSTGLSDIVPVTPHARSFVMLEQIAGMLYLALVVARVIALVSARAHRATLRAEHAAVEASTWEPPAEEPVADQVAAESGPTGRAVPADGVPGSATMTSEPPDPES